MQRYSLINGKMVEDDNGLYVLYSEAKQEVEDSYWNGAERVGTI